MPKLPCYCSEVINLSPIPNNNEYRIISSANLYKLPFEFNFDLLLENSISVIKCPNCKRLYFFDYDKKELTLYKLEKVSELIQQSDRLE